MVPVPYLGTRTTSSSYDFLPGSESEEEESQLRRHLSHTKPRRGAWMGPSRVTETSRGFLYLCPASLGNRSPSLTQIQLSFKWKRAQLHFQ